jgi:aryl-alcohol dehydrogenase-like predicted oxidoreductase
VLSGAATTDQLRSNVRALDVAWDDEAERQLAALVERPVAYWGRRADLAWG